MKSELIQTVKAYLQANGYDVPDDSVLAILYDFVVEKFNDRRCYSDDFSEAKIEKDHIKHKATITMAMIDIESKVGAEGETSHSENGISRSYESAYISSNIFSGIFPYVGLF